MTQWRFLQIRSPQVAHLDFQQVMRGDAQARARQFTIVHPMAQAWDGLRQDAIPHIHRRVAELAREAPQREWLLITDQGEHDVHGRHHLPRNCHAYHRRFTMAQHLVSAPPVNPHPHRWLFCPMGRADWIRTRWWDLMTEHDQIQGNRVSYLVTDLERREPDPRLYDTTGGRHTAGALPYTSIDPHPLTNAERHVPRWREMQECVMGVSVETCAVDPQAWYNERIYTMLRAGLMPVVIAGAGAMGGLESLGFRVPDYWDWRVMDDWPVDNWAEGLDKMRETMRQIVIMQERHKIEDLWRDWLPHAEHNQSHWRSLERQHELEDRWVAEWCMTLTHTLSRRDLQHLRPHT